MPQVVDSSNLVQLATTGSVPDFKAPDATKPADQKPADQLQAKPSDTASPSGEAKAADGTDKSAPAKDEPARDESGKFVKADEKAGEKPAQSGDDDDAQLTEKVRKIIGKKHRRMMEAEEFARERDQAAERDRRRAEAAERELERIRSGKSDGPKAGDGDAGRDPDKPKQADFKTVGDFTEALVRYEAKKAGKEAAAQAETQRQQEQANAIASTFAERQDEFRKTTPDYDEVVGATEVELHNVGLQYLLESEVGPQLGYYLAKPENREEVARLRKLSPTRLIAELGKLETKFEKKAEPAPEKGSEAKPAAREVSKAPAPIAVLEAKSTPIQKDPSQMSVSELREHRRQEALAKAGR